MRTKLVLALAAALGCGPAAAADQAMDRDVRCVIAMSVLTQDPQYRAVGGAGTLYFVGKIDGRDPVFDLPVAIRRMTGQISIAEEIRRCSAEVKARNDALQALGRAMRDSGLGG